MTQTGRVIVGVLVSGMMGWVGAGYAEREGSGSHHHEGSHAHHHAVTFQDGEAVELTGRITGRWLTVTDGPHAGKRFALVESRTLEDLQESGPATAAYHIEGTALKAHGGNRILISSFQRVSGTPSAFREGN